MEEFLYTLIFFVIVTCIYLCLLISVLAKADKIKLNRISKVRRSFYDWQDKRFEKITGCDFGGIIHFSQLKFNSSGGQYGNSYQAAWTRNIKVLLKQALKINKNPSNFIDIGSGKGKVCIYAAMLPQLTKTNICGIELDKTLVEISIENKKKARKLFFADNVQFIRDDALTYNLPTHGSSIIFLFNTLRGEGFLQMMKRFKGQMTPQDIICYSNDVERETMFYLGFTEVYSDRKFKISIWKK